MSFPVLASCLFSVCAMLRAAGPAPPPPTPDPPPFERLVVAPGEELAASGEGTLEAAWDGGLLRPVSAPLAAPASGAHWLTLAVRDRAGNLSAPRWVRVEVDGQAPLVEITVEPATVPAEDGGAAWARIGARAEARAVDRPAGVAALRLKAPGGRIETAGEPAPMEISAAGAVDLEAEAVDRVGNRGTASLALRVDAEPPAVSWRFDGPQHRDGRGTWFVGPGTGLSAVIEDAASGVGGWTPTADGEPSTAEALARPWTAGAHRAAGEAWDRVGNRGKAEEIAFVVDARAPAIEIEIISEQLTGLAGGTLYRRPVRLRLTPSDDAAGVASLERAEGAGGPWAPAAGEIAVDAGELRLRAADRVGNTAEYPFTFPTDATPPRVGLRTNAGEIAAGETVRLAHGEPIHLSVVEEESGLASATYSLGGSPPLPLPASLAIGESWSGERTLEIEAIDRLGNRGRAVWHLRRPEGTP